MYTILAAIERVESNEQRDAKKGNKKRIRIGR